MAPPVAAVALADTRVTPVIGAQDISVASPNRHSRPRGADRGRGIRCYIITGVLLGAFCFGWFLASSFDVRFGKEDELMGRAAVDAIVERIIAVESDSIPNSKNSRSSATGPAQFIDETWLDLIRAYRLDLIRGHNRADLLKLRQDPKLAREITKHGHAKATRFARHGWYGLLGSLCWRGGRCRGTIGLRKCRCRACHGERGYHKAN
jgi:hypothetical protein